MAVYKSNQLARSKELVTIPVNRVIYSILSQTFQGDLFTTEDWYSINVEKYAEMFQLSKRQAYADIKKAALDAYSSTVSMVTELDNGTRDVTIFRIFQAVNYNDGEGSIEVQWSNMILKHISGTMLQGLDGKYKAKGQVTKLDENILSAMQTSVYTAKLYEFLKSWEYKKRVTVSLEELDMLFNGALSKYKTYGEAKRRILEPAYRDIKLLTGMKFEVREIKKSGGKKVLGLGFGFG